LDDVSDNKKKAAHVTGIVSINCTKEEWDHQVRRLGWVVLRETTKRDRVTCAGCLGVANPIVISI
jgi:hypothetical protein